MVATADEARLPSALAEAAAPPLRLFGRPTLSCGTARLAFTRSLRFQLLARLALADEPVDRDHLAYLFWPDQPNDTARRNLRKMLFDLKALPGLAPYPLRADATTAAWPIDSDARRFERAITAGRLEEALALGEQTLADGLDGGGSEFDAWLHGERERAGRRWRGALLHLVGDLPVVTDKALRWLDRALAEDPLDETLALARVRCLLGSGQTAAARRAYLGWEQALAAQLGVHPNRPWEQLLAEQRANTGNAVPPGAGSGAHALTPFVGREAELRLLAHRVFDEGRRLVTLHGPPGAGKTRLVQQFAARAPSSARVRVVALEALDAHPPGLDDSQRSTASLALIARIGAAWGQSLSDVGDPAAALMAALASPFTVLVLDNFEHRLGDLPLVDRLLQETRCTVLVTSRVRLGRTGEVVLPIGGLSVQTTQAGGSEALQLFIDRAAWVEPLDDATAAQAQRICELAGGLPLALELAARQCRHLPLAEVEQRLRFDLQTLAVEATPDVMPRQRSLQAAFEGSWRLLRPGLQRTLAGMSVLRGSFDLAAATAVVGATTALAGSAERALADLLDAGLLAQEPRTGRYRWHPFVREFAALKLARAGDDEPAAEHALCAHVVGHLQRAGLCETQPDQPTLAWVEREIDHVMAAWRHATAARRFADWEPLAEALAMHFEVRARYREGEQLLAAAHLDTSSGKSPEASAVLAAARVAVLRARLQHWLENEAARLAVEAALAIFVQHQDRTGRIACLRVLGVIAWRQGQADSAIGHFMAALALCDADGLQARRAILLDGLGLAYSHLGRSDDALAAFSEALALNQRHGNPYQAVQNLINLSLGRRGHPAGDALPLAQRALELATQIGYQHYLPHCHATVARACLASGDAAAALSEARCAADMAHQSGDSYIESWALLGCVEAESVLGTWAAARADLRRGLDLSWTTHDTSLVLTHLVYSGELALRLGEPAWGAVLLDAVRGHPRLPRWLPARIDLLLGAEPQRAAAASAGSLPALVQATLGWLKAPDPHA